MTQTNSSFSLHLSESKRTFIFGSNLSNAKAKTEIGLPSTERTLYSDKARSFNQSKRTLYRNFIITVFKDYRSVFKTLNPDKSSILFDLIHFFLFIAKISILIDKIHHKIFEVSYLNN